MAGPECSQELGQFGRLIELWGLRAYFSLPVLLASIGFTDETPIRAWFVCIVCITVGEGFEVLSCGISGDEREISKFLFGVRPFGSNACAVMTLMGSELGCQSLKRLGRDNLSCDLQGALFFGVPPVAVPGKKYSLAGSSNVSALFGLWKRLVPGAGSWS